MEGVNLRSQSGERVTRARASHRKASGAYLVQPLTRGCGGGWYGDGGGGGGDGERGGGGGRNGGG